MKQKKLLFLQYVLLLFGLLISLKMLFFGLAPDEEYQITMSYRLTHGDGLFYKSWDTIQTSGFLNYFLIKLYLLFGTTDGIVLFLRFCGLAFQLLTALVLYRRLKKETLPINAALISCFCFAAFPKMIASPDFSNMLLWFQAWMICLLWDAYDRYKSTEKLPFGKLVLAALMMSASILSQACFLLIPITVILLCKLFPKHKWKSNLVFFGTCAISAVLYAGGIVIVNGLDHVIQGIQGILHGDITHASGANILGQSKYLTYIKNSLSILLYLAITAMLAILLAKLIHKLHEKWSPFAAFILLWNLLCCLCTLYAWFIQSAGYDGLKLYIPCFLCTFLIILAEGNLRGASAICPIPFFGVFLGVGIFLNVLWISNVPLTNNLSFLIPAVLWGMVFLSLQSKDQSLETALLLCITFTAIAGTLFTLQSSPAGTTIFDCDGQVTEGPAKGALLAKSVAEVYNLESVSFRENVPEGSTVLLVTNYYNQTLLYYLYLENNVNISHYSVNSTPTFLQILEGYWLIYPDKYPDVIVVNNSTTYIIDYGWIFDYIENYYNYSRVVETEYATYYYK